MIGAPLRRGKEERRLLGELLLESGLVRGDGLRRGLQAQNQGGGRLGYHLMRLGEVVPAALHLFLDVHLETLRPDLVDDLLQGSAAAHLPARLAHHYGIAAVRADDGVLDLAVSSADAPALKPAIAALTGLRVEPVICPPGLIAEALERAYPNELEAGQFYPRLGDALLVLDPAELAADAAGMTALRPGAASSDWLRAILCAAIGQGARRIEIAPRPGRTEVVFIGPEGHEPALALARGPFAGVAALIEGLARIAARGRTLPREGRFAVQAGRWRTVASVLAMPGLGGHTYGIDLRREIWVAPELEEGSVRVALMSTLDRFTAMGHGLLILGATGPAEVRAGMERIVSMLEGRLPRRVAAAGFEDLGLPRAGVPAAAPDLVVLPWAGGALEEARQRVVIAVLPAADACDAAEQVARAAIRRGERPPDGGILAERLFDALCHECRVPYDLADLMAPFAAHHAVPRVPFWTSPGCSACRGSGFLRLARVCEFLSFEEGDPFRAGTRARALRAERARLGRRSLFQAAVRAAADGRIDVKEALRLLHEQR